MNEVSCLPFQWMSNALAEFVPKNEIDFDWLLSVSTISKSQAIEHAKDWMRACTVDSRLNQLREWMTRKFAHEKLTSVAIEQATRFAVALANESSQSSTSESIQQLNMILDANDHRTHFFAFVVQMSEPLLAVLCESPRAISSLYDCSNQSADASTPTRDELVSRFFSRVESLLGAQQTAREFRLIRNEEAFRIACQIGKGSCSLSQISQLNTTLVEAICETAVRKGWQIASQRFGIPEVELSGRDSVEAQQTVERTKSEAQFHGTPKRPARFSVLASGRLGGGELSFQNGISLMFLAELDGVCNDSRSVPNRDFFERFASIVLEYLTNTKVGKNAFLVDMKFRAFGDEGPLVMDARSAIDHYELAGRTWQRMAYIKTRGVAGDLDFADRWLEEIQGWVYKRFLSRADISGIRAVKQRADRRASEKTESARDVKSGIGGIRDIEFTIQFLQLLNGGDTGAEWHSVRSRSTLDAIAALARLKCLNDEESELLEKHYREFRVVEHALQLAFGFDARTMPDPSDTNSVANFQSALKLVDPASEFAQIDYVELTDVVADKKRINREILLHLMHEVFSDSDALSDETDLILDPGPDQERIDDVLSRHRFRNPAAAFSRLQRLSIEEARFLSSRRCRHFFSGIAPELLATLSKCPDPDDTLKSLERVARSLGGKGVLWEMFSSNRAAMELCLRLCSACHYLTAMLQNQPGMIDELIDSLMLGSLPENVEMQTLLSDLTRNAKDVDSIVHAFKSSMHLRIGVSDVLHKQSVNKTLRSLAEVAEHSLGAIVNDQMFRMVQSHGMPSIANGHPGGEGTAEELQSEMVIVALGKLGGQEPNYHSDLDLMFIYVGDGQTRPILFNQRFDSVPNQVFHNQLAQRLTQRMNRVSKFGKLYDVDTSMRPRKQSGQLALSLSALAEYVESSRIELWERKLLCKARVIWGSQLAAEQVKDVIQNSLAKPAWQESDASKFVAIRQSMLEGASSRNLKRGVGGTIEIEDIVQALQLQHPAKFAEKNSTNTFDLLDVAAETGILHPDTANLLSKNYEFLRKVESCLRLMDTARRHDLPKDEHQLNNLAFLMNLNSHQELTARCDQVRRDNRDAYAKFFGL